MKQFDHPPPLCAQHAPHKWLAPIHGSPAPQTATPNSQATPLDQHGTTRIQQISGTFMCHGCCILPALNKMSSKQAAPTINTADSSNWLMAGLSPRLPQHCHPTPCQRHGAQNHCQCRLPRATQSLQQRHSPPPPRMAQRRPGQWRCQRTLQNLSPPPRKPRS
jgi:hypothetical protein